MIRELPKAAGRKERRWEIVAYVGVDPLAEEPKEKGKRKRERRVSRIFYGTKRAAEAFESELITKANNGQLSASTSALSHLLDRWLEHIESRGRSPWTLRGYRSCIERSIRPSLGHLKLSELSAQHLDLFYERELATGLSPKTVRQFHAILSAAIHQGAKWGVIDENVGRHATPPSAPTTPSLAPTPEMVRALISAAEKRNRVLATLIVLAAVIGARRGELCALRWSDIDLDEGIVHIRRAIYDGGRNVVEKDTKTHQERSVSLDDLGVAVLRAHRAAEEQRRTNIAPRVADPYVFSPDPNGLECYRPSSVTHFFGHVRDELGIKGVRLHDLRHFSVSRALNAGIDPLAVSKRHGHRSTRMTLEVYGHALPQGDRDAASVTGQLILGAVNSE